MLRIVLGSLALAAMAIQAAAQQVPAPSQQKPATSQQTPATQGAPAPAAPAQPTPGAPAPPPPNATATPAAPPPLDPTWTSQLSQQLQQAQKYPEGARQRREEGRVLVTFVVGRDGHVTSRQVVQSSGHPDLDAEAIALIDRAQPMPVFPSSMTQDQVALTVPVSFTLARQ